MSSPNNTTYADIVATGLRNTAEKHQLHIDDAGALNEEITGVLEGRVESDQFIDRIEERLGLSTDKAIELAADINLEIFIPLRELALREGGDETIQNNQTEREAPSREDLLSEIEDPAPTTHPFSAVDQIRSTTQKTLEQPQKDTPESVAKDFIAGKLSEKVNLPSQKYQIDPYREPTE